VLSEKFSLHDVPDVEGLVSQIICKSGLELSYHEREDLEQELIIECWALSKRYDPAGIRSFGIYARRILALRTVDWVRRYRGRTRWKFAGGDYNRDRVQLLSLGDPLAESYAERTVDSAADSNADLHGLLGAGGGDLLRGDGEVGEGEDDVAA
jgi:DNA-directed RNA polymerase specialized sigma24 family protein